MYSQAIILGILISILYTELTGYSAGLVVPGYLALSLHSPLRAVYTLLAAAVALLALRGLAKVMILYGRRRFAFLIILAFLVSSLFSSPGGFLPGADVIGYVIPGIAAREMDRQGIWMTLLSLGITGGLTALLLTLLGYPVLR